MNATEPNSPTAGIAPSSVVNALEVRGLNFAYGKTPILCDVNLQIPRGGFFALLGPSGCGKSTLLKVISGELNPRSGSIHLKDRDATKVPMEKRNIGMVFQNYALFPHLTAKQNVAFGLEVRRINKAEIQRRVSAMLERVNLQSTEWDRKPEKLSGGQQQRVALARALVIEPDLLLLDEPLANLDSNLRSELRGELKRLAKDTGTATLLVTHDRAEALATADTLGVMNAGQLLQVGPPEELYSKPTSVFVAEFLGDANWIPGTWIDRDDSRRWLLRPEAIRIGPGRSGRVLSAEYLGSQTRLMVEVEGVTLKLFGKAGVGEVVEIAFDAKAIKGI